MRDPKSPSWAQVKKLLRGQGTLVFLDTLRELYELSAENRRFLHARFLSREPELDRYRRLVRNALAPDPLSPSCKVSLAAGKQAIRTYERATRDPVGTVDLMLAYVESGTFFAADVGYGDQRFFESLASMLFDLLERLRLLPQESTARLVPRLTTLREHASKLGWGYGDHVVRLLARSLPEHFDSPL